MRMSRNSEIHIVKDARQEFNLDVFIRSLKSVLYPATDAQVCSDAHVHLYSNVISLSESQYTSMDSETFNQHLRRVASRSEPGGNCVSLKSYASASPEIVEHLRRVASRSKPGGHGVFPKLHASGSSGLVEQFTVLSFAEETLADVVFLTIELRNTWLSIMDDLENKIFEVPNGIITFNDGPKTYRGAKEDLLFCLEKLCLDEVEADPDLIVSERITDKAASANAIEQYLTPLPNSVSVYRYHVNDIFGIIYKPGPEIIYTGSP